MLLFSSLGGLLSEPLKLPDRGVIRAESVFNHEDFPFGFSFPVDTFYKTGPRNRLIRFHSNDSQSFLLTVFKGNIESLNLNIRHPCLKEAFSEKNQSQFRECRSVEKGIPFIRRVGLVLNEGQYYLIQLTCVEEFENGCDFIYRSVQR